MTHGNTRFSDADKAKARRLYVEDGLSMDAVTQAIGCSARTTGIWAAAGNWKEDRASWLRVHNVPIEDLEDRAIRKLMGRLEREADALAPETLLSLLTNINRFKALIAKRQGYRVLDAALVVGEEFQTFVLQEFPEEAPVLLNAWKEFLEELNRRTS